MSEETKFAEGLLKSERNSLLKNSDWTQASDSPLSDDKKKEWATYRQTLRDLPSTTSPSLGENEQLTNVIWPTKPKG